MDVHRSRPDHRRAHHHLPDHLLGGDKPVQRDRVGQRHQPEWLYDRQLLAGAQELDLALRARLHDHLHAHHRRRGAGVRHDDRARARAADRRARGDDGPAADPLVDDHRHQRRAVGLHLPGDLRRGRCHPQRGRPRLPEHPRPEHLGHHRLDDRRHLEDHPVRGHHRAGRPGDAARGYLRGGRGGRLIGLVHLLADHRPAAAAHARAGRAVPRAAGVRAVRPALCADQRRPGHGDHLAGHPGLQRDLQEPLVWAGRGGRHHHRGPRAARLPAFAADLPGPGREGRN